MINPTVTRLTDNHQHDLLRHFPGKGEAAVKVGQQVEASDIVAHCEVSSGQRLIKVAHALGVSASSVKKHLIRNIGDRIYQGEVIARVNSLLGLVKKEVKSPADGVITDIDRNGDVVIKFLPLPVRLTAGAGGKVKEIGQDSVLISTVATEVKGPISSGKERDGSLKIACGPEEFLLPQNIDASSAGKILVGGAILERSAIEKALTVGVHGIICGGINHRDYLSLGVSSDVGLTVLITEGFGTFPMGGDIYDKLKSLEGRFAFISGELGRLIIPELAPKVEKSTESPPSGWRVLKVGDNIRILHEKKQKLLGTVKEIKENQVLPSGWKADTAVINVLGGGELTVAAANLEILDQ